MKTAFRLTPFILSCYDPLLELKQTVADQVREIAGEDGWEVYWQIYRDVKCPADEGLYNLKLALNDYVEERNIESI